MTRPVWLFRSRHGRHSMPSGRTHGKASAALAGALLFYWSYRSGDFFHSSILAGGALSNIILTPDLDQQTNSWIENKLLRSRSPFIRALGHLYIKMFSWYAHSIPHRHWLSHSPIIGTVFRVIYIFPLIAITLMGASVLVRGLEDLTSPGLSVELWYWFAGLAAADTLHWFMDFAPKVRRR